MVAHGHYKEFLLKLLKVWSKFIFFDIKLFLSLLWVGKGAERNRTSRIIHSQAKSSEWIFGLKNSIMRDLYIGFILSRNYYTFYTTPIGFDFVGFNFSSGCADE